MSDLTNRISQQHTSTLERIMKHVPGFKGYQEMQDRRTADTMLRGEVVRLLKEQLTALVQAEKAVLNGGGLSYMSKMKDAKSKFQVFIDRIGTAMPGYAGFFAAIKIGPDELQQLYNFDADLFDYVDKFKAKIADIQTAATTKEGLDKAIDEFDALTVEANNAFSNRSNVITAVK